MYFSEIILRSVKFMKMNFLVVNNAPCELRYDTEKLSMSTSTTAADKMQSLNVCKHAFYTAASSFIQHFLFVMKFQQFREIESQVISVLSQI